MNASSNYQIIMAIIDTIRSKNDQRIYTPGAFGNIGGYPVMIGYKNGMLDAWIDESVFTFEEMDRANRTSMNLDGIENIRDGKLYYSDALIQKSIKAFSVELPKVVSYENIEATAEFIINQIIIPQLNQSKK